LQIFLQILDFGTKIKMICTYRDQFAIKEIQKQKQKKYEFTRTKNDHPNN
jgi:hypothetical protein